MSYVFGGMRGTAWVNTFQTALFLIFGAAAMAVIGWGMGGFSTSAEALLVSPAVYLNSGRFRRTRRARAKSGIETPRVDLVTFRAGGRFS